MQVLNTIWGWYKRASDFVVRKSDPGLLLFLVFMMNYRFAFKILALVVVYVWRPNFKFKRDGLFFFYVSILLIAIANYLFVSRDFSLPHTLLVATGCLIWLACLLSYHQVRLWVDTNPAERLINTLKLLTLLNFAISAYDFLKVAVITRTVNPYTQISPPPYGISSGDLIGGVFGEMHLVNTIVSCFLVLFFLYQTNFFYTVLALIPFLLTGSNLGTLLLSTLLFWVFVFNRHLIKKYFAIVGIAIISLFYIKVTPENQKYMLEVAGKVYGQFTGKRNKTKPRPPLPPTGVSALPDTQAALPPKRKLTKNELIVLYLQQKHKNRKGNETTGVSQHDVSTFKILNSYERLLRQEEARESDRVFFRKDSLKRAKLQNPLFEYGRLKRFDLDAEAGKLTSFKQTATYLSQSGTRMAFGGGVGSFSSRLAFIASGLVTDSRILMQLPRYETPEFVENHKAIFKYLMFLDDETHSITNLPFSWYNELLGEYGLLGLLAFVVFYLAFFARRARHYSYGRIIFVAMLGFFLFDYWYERLSVMVFFELIMLVDLKLNTKTDSVTA